MFKPLLLIYFSFISFLGFSFKKKIIFTPKEKEIRIDLAFSRAKKTLYNNTDSSFIYLKLIENRIENNALIGEWYYLMANIFMIHNQNDKAVNEYKKALKVFSVLQNTSKVQLIYNELGDLFLKQNDCYGSINYYTENYKYLTKIKSRGKLKNPILLAEVCNKLATIFKQIHNYNNANRFYREAYQISSEGENDYFNMLSYIEWCGTMNQLGRSDIALSKFMQFMQLSRQIPTSIEKKMLLYIALAYKNTYQLQKSNKIYDQLLSSKKYILTKNESTTINFNKAIIAFLNKDYNKVNHFTYLILETTKNQLLIANTYKLLMWTNLRQKNYEKAQSFLDQYKSIKQKYNEAEINTKIKFWNSKKKYEELVYRDSLIEKQIDSQQKNAAILHQKELNYKSKELSLLFVTLMISIAFIVVILFVLKKIRVKNIQLKSSLKEKEVLLKEVHHRVKNNFQIISSLLRLQTNAGKSDEKTTNLLVEAQNRIYSMSLVHQKIYSSDSLEKVEMGSYFSDLIKAVSGTFMSDIQNLEHSINCNGISFPLEKVVPLGLIANEAISNSLKYGKSQNNKVFISIQLAKKENHYSLEINDHGGGFPEKMDVSNLNSLGLELINILTKQIDGEWLFENRNGAYICITFPE